MENEFAGIWRDYEAERQRAGQAETEANKNEDETRAEYRAIAERRVRLGLVLAEIGQKAGVTVEEQDLTDAVVERARQFPGQEKEVWDFYRKNENALASLRAPIYEERVVAHLAGIVGVSDKTVTREELFAEDDEKAARRRVMAERRRFRCSPLLRLAARFCALPRGRNMTRG